MTRRRHLGLNQPYIGAMADYALRLWEVRTALEWLSWCRRGVVRQVEPAWLMDYDRAEEWMVEIAGAAESGSPTPFTFGLRDVSRGDDHSVAGVDPVDQLTGSGLNTILARSLEGPTEIVVPEWVVQRIRAWGDRLWEELLGPSDRDLISWLHGVPSTLDLQSDTAPSNLFAVHERRIIAEWGDWSAAGRFGEAGSSADRRIAESLRLSIQVEYLSRSGGRLVPLDSQERIASWRTMLSRASSHPLEFLGRSDRKLIRRLFGSIRPE